ncbi:copper-translocating P-type ATPase [Pseudoflavitalea rhizosphaerae]|uniref:copper-translocating P-type ATPase n=1 Tax=Pseudoflavitalea rhizosphaerae TaxID=1884793 RepID=UPI000F8DCEDD|nr:copper-translocating P-type ATPase [Pseudoflavitalea rhizosphaerae]
MEHHHHDGRDQRKKSEQPSNEHDQHGHDHAQSNAQQAHAVREHTHHQMHDMDTGSGGYDEHAGHHTANFLQRFWISLILTIPLLLLSKMIQHWAGFEISFPGDRYALFALGTAIFLYGGWPFLTGLVNELKHRNPGMMTLVAVAITTAYLYSTAVVFGLPGMDFFWELATLIVIMLLGHWLEMRSQMAASNALESLVKLLPSVVHLKTAQGEKDIPLEQLKHEDIITVKPGEKIPADGLVMDGSSYVNESMLTGESVPVKKEKNGKLIGGSINGDGVLQVRVTGTGSNSYLNKVIGMVKSAQGAKSRTQNLAGKVAKWLTIISISVGLITFIVWLFAGKELSFALERMVTVMVTSCPHALGVAIPLVVAISTTLSATHGLLIRNRTAFENARLLNLIIFDKTGTLTKGSHEVQQVIPLQSGISDKELLQYAAAVQQNSEHHIARGIIRKLNERNLELWPSTNFEYMQGMGVSGVVKGKKIVAAGPNYFSNHHLSTPVVPDSIDQSTETITYVLIDGEPAGIITLADSIRESAPKAIVELQQMGIKTYLLTGDNEKVAASVSQKLKMDGFIANVLPHEKQEKVKAFQQQGYVVAMTGDGVNDAPALAQADVGIAVGSGTDVAAETADIILVDSDPADVVQLISFGKATYRKMVQNLVWAAGYNIIAIPLAAGILYPKFMLSPAMGAVLMSVSTIVVAINAKLLRVK